MQKQKKVEGEAGKCVESMLGDYEDNRKPKLVACVVDKALESMKRLISQAKRFEAQLRAIHHGNPHKPDENWSMGLMKNAAQKS